MTKIFVVFSIASLLTWMQYLHPYSSNSLHSFSSEFTHDPEFMGPFLRKIRLSPQKTTVSGKEPSVVKGAKGSKLYVNPADLETVSGKPIGETIQVELLELTNQSDLLRCNAPTVSDGKLLVSGGSFNITMGSNGEQLRLKKGKTMDVEFQKTTNHQEMSLFYGVKTPEGINWKPSGIAMKVQVKPLVEPVKEDSDFDSYCWGAFEKEQIPIVYEAVKLANLGWINIDKFYDEPAQSVIAVNFSPSTKSARVYVAFKLMNSVLSFTYEQNGTNRMEINSLPEGKSIRVIVVEQKEDGFYTYHRDGFIKNGAQLTVNTTLTSDTNLKKIFDIKS